MGPSPAPAQSNGACGFPALRFPARFAPGVMGPSDGERFQQGATSSRLLHLIPSHRPSSGRRSSIAWSCRLLGAVIRRPCLPCGERSTSSRVPWLRRHYPPSSLLRTRPPPSRRPPTSRGTPGYRAYPASAAFATGRGRFLQLLDLPCVTVLSLPPRRSVRRPQSACPRPCCLRPGPRGSAFGDHLFSRPLVGSLAVRPGDALTIPRMAWSVGFIHFVSSADATQATGGLTVPPVGLPPTEHASLRWPRWSARTPS